MTATKTNASARGDRESGRMRSRGLRGNLTKETRTKPHNSNWESASHVQTTKVETHLTRHHWNAKTTCGNEWIGLQAFSATHGLDLDIVWSRCLEMIPWHSAIMSHVSMAASQKSPSAVAYHCHCPMMQWFQTMSCPSNPAIQQCPRSCKYNSGKWNIVLLELVIQHTSHNVLRVNNTKETRAQTENIVSLKSNLAHLVLWGFSTCSRAHHSHWHDKLIPDALSSV